MLWEGAGEAAIEAAERNRKSSQAGSRPKIIDAALPPTLSSLDNYRRRAPWLSCNVSYSLVLCLKCFVRRLSTGRQSHVTPKLTATARQVLAFSDPRGGWKRSRSNTGLLCRQQSRLKGKQRKVELSSAVRVKKWRELACDPLCFRILELGLLCGVCFGLLCALARGEGEQ